MGFLLIATLSMTIQSVNPTEGALATPELVFEIAEHLERVDLVRFARTCKLFSVVAAKMLRRYPPPFDLVFRLLPKELLEAMKLTDHGQKVSIAAYHRSVLAAYELA